MTWNTKHLSTALNDLERIADETLRPHDEYVSILVFFCPARVERSAATPEMGRNHGCHAGFSRKLSSEDWRGRIALPPAASLFGLGAACPFFQFGNAPLQERDNAFHISLRP